MTWSLHLMGSFNSHHWSQSCQFLLSRPGLFPHWSLMTGASLPKAVLYFSSFSSQLLLHRDMITVFFHLKPFSFSWRVLDCCGCNRQCLLPLCVSSLTYSGTYHFQYDRDRQDEPLYSLPQMCRFLGALSLIWDVFYQAYYVWFSLCVGKERKKRKGSQYQESSHRGNSSVRTYIRGRHSSLQLISVIQCVLDYQV